MRNVRALSLAQTREVRDRARAAFDAQLQQVKDDLAARGVGGRIADRVGQEALMALDHTLEIAGESKGVIAGTLAALALWLLRNPIIALVTGLFDTGEEKDSENDDADDQG